MINYEKVAEKIFSVIKGHDHDLVMFTEEGMETSNAEEARRFFVSKPNYMVTLDGEARHIKINKNSNVTLEEIESVMKQLKNLATSNMLKTEIRVFGKEITPKDFAYQAKNLKEPAMENIHEASFSRMHGFKKTSYQTLESTKIVVRHRKPIDEEVRGSRARNIQAIFIEHAGERFRFPHNNLAGARAMARHINEGGNMQDAVGQYIIESIANYNKLMEFVRYARTNKLINENSEDIIKTIRESVGVIRREIGQLQGAKTYGPMSETIQTRDPNVIEEEDTAELKDMFTVRKFDEHMGDILPIVKKLMDNKQVWRDALIEASEKEIAISEKTELSETDVFEFDSPTQRMGYKVRDIAERMIGESDLQTFVGKVAGKLIEGEQISAFEKKIVGNVLGNAVIREEEDIEEDDIDEDEKCTTKDVIDLISEQFDLKMKMVEHEDIFTESGGVFKTTYCPECDDFALDLQDQYGDDGHYVCNTCGYEETMSPAPRRIEFSDYDDDEEEFDAEGAAMTSMEPYFLGDSKEVVNENLPTHPQSEWWKNDPDDLLAYMYWLSGQIPPHPKEEAWEKVKAQLSKKNPPPEGVNPMLGDGPLQEAEGDKCIRCGKGTMEEGDTFFGPAERCNHCNFQRDLQEGSMVDNTCLDCNGTGKAQDSIFDDDECSACNGEGYFPDEEEDYYVPDYMQEEARMLELAGVKLNEDEQLYNVWHYTSGNEGASGYTVDLKKVPLSKAVEYLDSEIAEAEVPDEEWEVEIGERKQRAHYGGAVVIRQGIEFNDAVERYDGYGGYRDHSHTYTIAPTYWNPRKDY